MNAYLPSNYNCPSALKDAINEKIDQLHRLDDFLPLVFIVMDLRTYTVVYMSQRGLEALGTSLQQLYKLGPEYFNRYFNPEDVDFYLPRFMDHLKNPENRERWFSFFQQVKTGDQRSFEWYFSAAMPFFYDESQQPLLSLTFATKLHLHDHLTEKTERLMQENHMLRTRQHQFLNLTKKEREVLRAIGSGLTVGQIAASLFSSELTIRTHRRNIKKKTGSRTDYDLIRFAQAFNLV
ncbi:hypothetical protein GCM10027051_00570 [Niabella terrae]